MFCRVIQSQIQHDVDDNDDDDRTQTRHKAEVDGIKFPGNMAYFNAVYVLQTFTRENPI